MSSTITAPGREPKAAPRTPHDRRLHQLVNELLADLNGRRSPDAIRACAELVLAQYRDMPEHRHVAVAAAREARERLRRGA